MLTPGRNAYWEGSRHLLVTQALRVLFEISLVRSLSATSISADGPGVIKREGRVNFGDLDHEYFFPVAGDLAGEDAKVEDSEYSRNHCIITVFQDSDVKSQSASGGGIRGMVD